MAWPRDRRQLDEVQLRIAGRTDYLCLWRAADVDGMRHGPAGGASRAPGLTTLRQPIDGMGSHAADLLLDAMGRQAKDGTASAANRTIVFTPTLVHRESCAPARGGQPRA